MTAPLNTFTYIYLQTCPDIHPRASNKIKIPPHVAIMAAAMTPMLLADTLESSVHLFLLRDNKVLLLSILTSLTSCSIILSWLNPLNELLEQRHGQIYTGLLVDAVELFSSTGASDTAAVVVDVDESIETDCMLVSGPVRADIETDVPVPYAVLVCGPTTAVGAGVSVRILVAVLVNNTGVAVSAGVIPVPGAVLVSNPGVTVGAGVIPVPSAVVVGNPGVAVGAVGVLVPGAVLVINPGVAVGAVVMTVPGAVLVSSSGVAVVAGDIEVPGTVVISGPAVVVGARVIPVPGAVIVEKVAVGAGGVPVIGAVLVSNPRVAVGAVGVPVTGTVLVSNPGVSVVADVIPVAAVVVISRPAVGVGAKEVPLPDDVIVSVPGLIVNVVVDDPVPVEVLVNDPGIVFVTGGVAVRVSVLVRITGNNVGGEIVTVLLDIIVAGPGLVVATGGVFGDPGCNQKG